MAVCVGCGLFVDAGLLKVQTNPNGCLVCDDTLGLSVEVSPNDCNALTCTPNGLYVPCHDGVSGAFTCGSPQQGTLPLTTAGGDAEYNFNSCEISICNPTCCSVEGIINIQVGGLYADVPAGPGVVGTYGYSILMVNPDGTGMIAAGPPTNKVVHNHVPGSPVLLTDLNNMADTNRLIIGSNDCVTYVANLRFVSQVNPIDLHGTIDFEFQWILTHVGCCDHVG